MTKSGTKRNDALPRIYRMPFYILFGYILSFCTWFYMSQAIPPPGPPEHLSVVSDVSNIGIQWDPPTETYGNIRNFIVSWAILPNLTELTNIVDGDVTMSIVSAQDQMGRLFRIRVRAENDGGIGPYSVPKYTRIECGKKYDLFPGSNVTVISPTFHSGNHIKPGVFCKWTIKTFEKYSLQVYFDELDISEGDSNNCVDIYIDISGVGRVCGHSHTGKRVRTSLQSVQVTLKSGETSGGHGFRISFKSVVLLPGPPTRVSVTTSDHAIKMSWEPPRENTLPITAYRIRYGVISNKHQLLVTVGQNMLQFAINTDRYEGKLMTINVCAAIGMEEGETSKAIFVRAPCRRRLHLSGTVSVNISSPGYPRAYPSSIICKWIITSENSVTSLITYLDFRLEDTSFCSSDFLSFSFRETVEHECSMMSLPKTIQTAAQNYTVTFVTDGKNEFAGFLIQITSKVLSLGTDTPPSSTSRTKPNFISNNKTDMTSYSPTEAILTTTHNLMTSLITANRSHLTSTKPITYTKETFLTSLVANTRRPVTVKKSDSNDVAAKTLTNISTTQTHFYNPELIFTNTTAQKYSGVSTNTSTMEHRPVELSTSFSNFSSSSSGSADVEDNDVVLAVVLSTLACAVVMIISTCYFRWRRRHGQTKINIEPEGKYRVTNIELYDILGNQPQQQQHQQKRHCSKPRTRIAFDGDRKLETIPEYPEDVGIVKKGIGKSERKRCYSFPCCFSTRRRKIHREIKKSLDTFGFIDDKKSLEQTLQRKYCLRRTNSY